MHNHKVAKATYDLYASSRGIKDPQTAAEVDVMLPAGAKRYAIYNYLLAKGENVFKRDVDNIVQTHRKSVATKMMMQGQQPRSASLLWRTKGRWSLLMKQLLARLALARLA